MCNSAATQEQVYNKTAKEVIPCLLDGFNASVFAYGQTSAGKTFTMLGDRVKGEGVMVRALKDLFDGETWRAMRMLQDHF